VNKAIEKKIEQLRSRLQSLQQVMVAFSGGTDSCLLLKIAQQELNHNILAVTVQSPCFPKAEIKESKKFTEKHDIPHILLTVKIDEIENFSYNPYNRCYHCKKFLFNKIKNIAQEKNITFVLEGSHADDTSDYRPGLKALKELGIISPLKDAGLTKKEIRVYSKQIGLQNWNKTSSACLASRIPYESPITVEKLKQIEQAEAYLHHLGIKQCRVRHHGSIARIEIPKKEFSIVLTHANNINKKLEEQGFLFITLDLNGYQMGSLNKGIKK
jgi:uncharacterized protein